MPKDNERDFRQMLAQKVSGTSVGSWLLVPELLKLGAWDLIKGWSSSNDYDLNPRIALQLVNESAICVNRVRKKNSLGHQGFQLCNGMGRLVTDEQVHKVLNQQSIEQTQDLLENLAHQRKLAGHYKGNIIAIDPHRILSTSHRIMSKKQKNPDTKSKKMLQTFFSLCPYTGQPIMSNIASTGMPTTLATKKLLNSTEKIITDKSLILADKEHFTKELTSFIKNESNYDFLIPALNTSKIKTIVQKLTYQPLWPGYAVAVDSFKFNQDHNKYKLIVQREGVNQSNYSYKAFLTTSDNDPVELITKSYCDRWSIEEFFRFENDLGLNRASTLNLNIRYGKLAMAMIAQASIYQLRKKLKDQYKKWNAKHLAQEILAWSDGDIRVVKDKILVTFYGTPQGINTQYYKNLPSKLSKQGIDPKIPWLYNYKLDFIFK